MSRHNRERRKRRKDGLPNYLPALLAAGRKELAEGKLVPGRVYVTEVRHDEWCSLIEGSGPCDCSPDVGEPRPLPDCRDN